MRTPKPVEQEHLEFMKKYFSRKLIDGTWVDLLENTTSKKKAEEKLRAALKDNDADKLNQWFLTHLSTKGRKYIWSAHRNVDYRQRKPTVDRTLRSEVFTALMAWAKEHGANDVNDAVLLLLDRQNP